MPDRGRRLGLVAIATSTCPTLRVILSPSRTRSAPLPLLLGRCRGLHVCDLRSARDPRYLVPRDAGALGARDARRNQRAAVIANALGVLIPPAREIVFPAYLAKTAWLPWPARDRAPRHPRASQSRSLLPGQAHTLKSRQGSSGARSTPPPGPRTRRAIASRPRSSRQPPGGAARTGRPTALGAAPLGTPRKPTRGSPCTGSPLRAGLRARRAQRGQGLSGPALIADPGSTTYLRLDGTPRSMTGHLRLRDSPAYAEGTASARSGHGPRRDVG